MINDLFDIKVVVENCNNTEEKIKTIYLAGGGAKMLMLPESYALQQNHPNPFNPTTTIKYELPESSSISLVIYDLRGSEIFNWSNNRENAGYKRITWNGKDQNGYSIPAGVYIYKLTAKSHESDQVFTQSRKMVLMK
ncbi:MAG: T9SS type A sorting domain-containing protein [Candidatus Marinimicrobia bacterium]|nr:T9SS type A sorting domain-containing protein [Candidatus Neomarinimicrobiota bacterium]MBL7011018.1 T9SS type A sorting domain-containing protein [Candidatus Neomarinimicrobiota bacterium]MBL7031241.1 T9SS type A sorting domain-containing protein [Candidatus Neomarinimicrobiota bacterium]